MNLELVELQPYQKEFREQMISLWERSVKATHHFVTESGLQELKKLVDEIDFDSFSVYCPVAEGKVLGFIGLSGISIEMLFLDPDFIGRGLGKKMMIFAIEEMGANEVEVNEQNTYAVQFYKNFGFVAYHRSETDSNGKPYPVLKMRRAKHCRKYE